MKLVLLSCLFLVSTACFGQNLVPNPSFEEFDTCPDFAGQIYRAIGWQSSNSTPDYFNECAIGYNWCTVPVNFFGFRTPASGYAYTGIISRWEQSEGPREAISTTLELPLQIGHKYFVSFKVSLAGQANPSNFCGINKLGVLFSTTQFSTSNPVPLCHDCAQIYSDSIIIDTLNWTRITGAFIADSNYVYINIGRFNYNTYTDSIQLNGNGCNAYYYIDDVCVSTDSFYCEIFTELPNVVLSGSGTEVYPNPAGREVIIKGLPYDCKELELYNTNGALVRETNVINGYEARFDLSMLPEGIYSLIIRRSKSIQIKKIVKTNL